MKISKVLSSLIALIFAACLFALPLSAATVPKTAELVGHATVYVPADTVTVNFCVESTGTDCASVHAANDKVCQKLKTAVGEYGTLSVESIYSYRGCEGGSIVLTSCFSLKSDKPDGIDRLAEALFDNGATGINYISYSLRDASKARQKALAEAVADGMNKAASLGIKGRPDEIRETVTPFCGEDCRREIAVVCDAVIVYH